MHQPKWCLLSKVQNSSLNQIDHHLLWLALCNLQSQNFPLKYKFPTHYPPLPTTSLLSVWIYWYKLLCHIPSPWLQSLIQWQYNTVLQEWRDPTNKLWHAPLMKDNTNNLIPPTQNLFSIGWITKYQNHLFKYTMSTNEQTLENSLKSTISILTTH